MALKNIKKVYDAGIPVALGTDSGATRNVRRVLERFTAGVFRTSLFS
jgi:hypothetical protein